MDMPPPEVVAEIERLRADGWTLLDLEVQFGFSMTRIHKWTRHIVVPADKRRVGRPRIIDYRTARQLDDAGVPRARIAERFGVTGAAITRALR